MTSPHERLDQAMEARRLDLDMLWEEVADAAKVSPGTLRAIRAGTNNPSSITKRRIENALQWKPGSIDAIRADRPPTPIEAPSSRRAQDDEPSGEDRGEKLRRLVEEFEDDPPFQEMLRAALNLWEIFHQPPDPPDTHRSPDSEEKRAG